MEPVKEVLHQTLRRRLDEAKLEIGQTVSITEGVTGVVLARYIPSGGKNHVCCIVEIVSDQASKGAHKRW